jgi:hypothetical protein
MAEQIKDKLVVISGPQISLNTDADVLALSLPAMASLDSIGCDFLTLEDLYPLKQSYADCMLLADAITNMLEECDVLCEYHLGVPRAFSSNGFWILHRLCDLYYLHCILDTIDAKYDNIDLHSIEKISPLSNHVIDFDNLNMNYFGSGINHVLRFMRAGSTKIVEHNSGINFNYDKFSIANEPLAFSLSRLPDALCRKGKSKFSGILRGLHIKKGCVWLVQGGYDVELLQQQNPTWGFDDSVTRIAKRVDSLANIVDNVLRQKVMLIAEVFFRNWFPRYEKWLIGWFETYFQKVVLKLPAVEEAIDVAMKDSKPKAVLYSIGIQNVLQESVARIANFQNVPVYCFKHGGVAEIFLKPSNLDPFLEHSNIIRRTQFLHSEVELSRYMNLNKVTTVVSGPLDHQTFSNKSTGSGTVLYSAGPPAHFTFKEMQKIISDYERHQFVEMFLSLSLKHKLQLSIKPHPAEWQVSYSYFEIMFSKFNVTNKKVRLISGGAIERILSGYELLVLDMVSTKVLSVALQLDILIILYIPIGFSVNTKTFPDLERRVYVVRNYFQLDTVLAAYKRGELTSRSHGLFSEKYFGAMDLQGPSTLVSKTIFKVF